MPGQGRAVWSHRAPLLRSAESLRISKSTAVAVGLFSVTVAVHVVLARHMYTPIIHADEFGYLMGAHFMARGGAPIGSPYYPGYSALLVPLWWISRNATTVYRWALDVNAVLAGVTVVLSYVLARRLAPRSGPLTWAGAAVVVGAYPALVMYSNLAESENLLVPGFLAVCLLVLRAVEVPTAPRWALAAAASGLLYSVHGRALAVAAAFVVTAAWSVRPWRKRAPQLLAAAAALVAALAVSEAWIHWVTRKVPGRQLPPGPAAPGLVSRVTTGSGLRHVGVILSGEGLYLMAAAAPLIVLAVAALAKGLRRSTAPAQRAPWNGFLLVSLLFGAGVGAVFLATGRRIDDAVYGRYVEVFAVPLLVVGAVTAARLRNSPRPVAVWRVLAAGAVAAVLLWLAVSAYWGATIRGPVVRTNIFGMADLVWGANATAHLRAVVALGVAVGGLVVVSGAYRILPALGVLVAVGAFVGPSVRAYGDVVDQSAAAVLEQVVPGTLVALQRRFPPVPCVSWDSSLPDAWGFYNTRVLVPDAVFPVFAPARSTRLPCSSGVVVAGRGFGALPPYGGARPVIFGNDLEAVWVMPGPLQARLDRAGWLLPAGFPAALPQSASTGSIQLVGAGPASSSMTLGQRAARRIDVVVTHGPGGAPWPNAASVGAVPNYAVRVAVAWFRGAGTARQQVAAARADLAVSLLPGQSEVVKVPVAPLAFGSTDLVPKYLAPGSYDVEVSLIQEGVRSWDATVAPVRLYATVTAR